MKEEPNDSRFWKKLIPVQPKIPPSQHFSRDSTPIQSSTSRKQRLLSITRRASLPTTILPSNHSPPPDSQRCGIPLCEFNPCILRSHHQYVERFIKSETHSTKSTPSSPLTFANFTTKLPIEGLDEHLPILRKLFYDYFSTAHAKLVTILVPPSPTFTTWRQELSRTQFNRSLTSQTLCLNFICTAHNYFSRYPSSNPNPMIGMTIQAQLMKVLRSILSDYHPAEHAKTVISIILTVVIADLTAGRSDRLLPHRQAMIRVLDSCGGLANLHEDTPLTENLDRILSITTGLPPLCNSWSALTAPIQRANLYPATYGSSLSSISLDPDVLRYATEVCRAIEILEGEHWTFEDTAYTPELAHFYHISHRVTGQFAHLNAWFARSGAPEEYVLLTTKIVEYVLCMDNYISAIPVHLANRLRLLLQHSNVNPPKWDAVKLWMGFVLTCIMTRWEFGNWAFEFSKANVERCYGERERWHEMALATMKEFVWSSRYDQNFFEVCRKLDGEV